jgi:hypothetical protein
MPDKFGHPPEAPLADDLLWGCAAIAAWINRPKSVTYHLLSKKRIPATKVGSIHVGSKRQLRQRFTGCKSQSPPLAMAGFRAFGQQRPAASRP